MLRPYKGFVTLTRRKSGQKSAVRVQRQRGAKQHAGDHECDYASSEPSGTHGHPEERSLANRVLRDTCDGREICCRGRLEPERLIDVTHSGNKTVTLAGNSLHENRLVLRLTDQHPQLVHGSVHVAIG